MPIRCVTDGDVRNIVFGPELDRIYHRMGLPGPVKLQCQRPEGRATGQLPSLLGPLHRRSAAYDPACRCGRRQVGTCCPGTAGARGRRWSVLGPLVPLEGAPGQLVAAGSPSRRGTEGSFSFTGLADDAGAAVEWVLQQPSVDKHRIALIGGAMGGHAALLHGATGPKVRAIVSICPLVDPGVFKLSKQMAEEFAPLLTGVTSDDLAPGWCGR